jgi:hypothetical protein
VTNGAPGPLADEAARLVEAIAEWARGTVGELPMPSIGNGPECQVCPICQLLSLVRRTQPETFGHLADASASMVAALRTVIDRHDHGGQRRNGVERIDLDDRDPEADPEMLAEPLPGVANHGAGAAPEDREALADALGVAGRRRSSKPRSTPATAPEVPPRKSVT